MNRIMKGGLIVLSLLIIVLLISLQGAILAKATKTDVTGVVDFSAAILIEFGAEWVDEGCNTHIEGRSLEGDVSLTIGERTVQGRDRIVYNCVVDAEGNGAFQLTEKTYFLGEAGDEPDDGNIIFEGSGQLVAKENQTVSGHFQFEGHNEFEETKLIITEFVERGITNIHDLEGKLIDICSDE